MLKLRSWEKVQYEGDGFTVDMEVKRLGFLEEKAFSVQMNRVRRDRVVKHMLIAQAEERERRGKLIARMNRLLVAAGHEAVPVGEDLDATYAAIEARFKEVGLEEPPLSAEELEDILRADEGRILERQEAMQEYMQSLDPAWLAQVFTDYVRNVSGLEIDDVAITTGEALAAVADQGLTLFVLEAIRGFAGLTSAEKKASSSPPISAPVAGPGESPATSAAPDAGTAHATAPESEAALSSSV